MRASAYFLYDWRSKDGSKVGVRMRGRINFDRITADASVVWCMEHASRRDDVENNTPDPGDIGFSIFAFALRRRLPRRDLAPGRRPLDGMSSPRKLRSAREKWRRGWISMVARRAWGRRT